MANPVVGPHQGRVGVHRKLPPAKGHCATVEIVFSDLWQAIEYSAGLRFRTRLAAAVLFGATAALVCTPASAQRWKAPLPVPDQFHIGRRTFFDIGPPFEFYEIFSVHSAANGSTLVERIQVTPPGDVCTQPATIAVVMGSIRESVADLLGGTNPCSIPEKDLRRELKRCKRCLVFSGADVVLQVRCGQESRRIRMDILDRDMFDPHPVTPEHTSWTMDLLGRLDRVLGSTIMDRPAFTVSEALRPPSRHHTSPLLGELEKGTLDSLFDRGSQTPSELFRQAQNPPPGPTVELTNISPFRPVVYELPKYPPLARAAHVGDQVRLTVVVQTDGHTSPPNFLSGNPLLRGAVAASVASWRFAPEAVGREMQVTIEFKMNCPSIHP